LKKPQLKEERQSRGAEG